MADPLQTNGRDYPSLIDHLFALLLYLLPHHLLSGLADWLTRSEWRPLKSLLIRSAIRLYGVDMSVAADPDPENYRSFNAFFTRKLAPDARPLEMDGNTLLSPVDGTVSQAGSIDGDSLIQAKGRDFSLSELLAGDPETTALFTGGRFITLYLSPKDYHRIHMPLAGSLTKMTHVPGRLFSVSPSTTRTVPNLFSRNERVINLFETGAGPMALIMVGAIFVASMDTVWAGTVTPRSKRQTHWFYSGKTQESVTLEKAAEMGRFNMGSTVILLFADGAVEWEERLGSGQPVRMGERLGPIKWKGDDFIDM